MMHRRVGCTVEEFTKEHPEHRDIILNEFPAIAMIETLAGPNRTNDPIPIHLGNYILEEELGRGGMGIVYSAHHPTLGNKIAVKLMPVAVRRDGNFQERFCNEAKICAGLDHPSIIPVFDYGEIEGYAYCTMRRIEGSNLKQVSQRWLHADERTTRESYGERWKLIAEIGVQAAEALEYAHSNGVVHRDVKPSNLILDEDGKVWISDFGTAKLVDADTKLTMTGDVVGTVRYMAPEQLRGKCTTCSDVFGLGLTLSELVATSCGIDSEQQAEKGLVAVGPEIWKKATCIPRPLAEIIEKACEYQPKDRYKSAEEMAFVLKRFLEGHRVADRRRMRNTRRKPWIRRARIAIGALSVLCFSVFAAKTPPNPSAIVEPSDAGTVKTPELSREEEIQVLLAQNPRLAYLADSKKFFMIRDGDYTWEEANKLSMDPSVNSLRSIPGQLATIRTKKENEVAWKLARDARTSIHLGASDQNRHGHWRWHHKGQLQDPFYQTVYSSVGFPTPGTEFTNFASDRPNFYPPDQHWLSLRYEDGKWRDIGKMTSSATSSNGVSLTFFL